MVAAGASAGDAAEIRGNCGLDLGVRECALYVGFLEVLLPVLVWGREEQVVVKVPEPRALAVLAGPGAGAAAGGAVVVAAGVVAGAFCECEGEEETEEELSLRISGAMIDEVVEDKVEGGASEVAWLVAGAAGSRYSVIIISPSWLATVDGAMPKQAGPALE